MKDCMNDSQRSLRPGIPWPKGVQPETHAIGRDPQSTSLQRNFISFSVCLFPSKGVCMRDSELLNKQLCGDDFFTVS